MGGGRDNHWGSRIGLLLLLLICSVAAFFPDTVLTNATLNNNEDNKELIVKSNLESVGTAYNRIDNLITRNEYNRIEDYHITNLILTSDVEGNLNAVNRVTGELLWSLVGGQSLVSIQSNENQAAKYVKTTPIPSASSPMKRQGDDLRYNEPRQEFSNTQTRRYGQEKMNKWKDGITWIVEPFGDGTVYHFSGRDGIEKLPLTIKELVLNSPFSIDDKFVYTGTRTSGIVKINARTGAIVESFGLEAIGTCSVDSNDILNEITSDPSNEFDDYFEEFDDQSDYFSSHSDHSLNDDDGPFINLGKTIYELSIHSKNNTSWNITYIQWGPNNLHSTLTEQNHESLDEMYIQPFHDSSLLALDVDTKSVRWVSNLPSVTVSIFDVFLNSANDEEYIILPHPIDKKAFVPHGDNESTYLDRTKEGSWYALSERHYPSLVRSAPLAKYITNERWRVPAVFANDDLLEISISGVHNDKFKNQDSLQKIDINNNKLAVYQSVTQVLATPTSKLKFGNEKANSINKKSERNADDISFDAKSPTVTFKGSSIFQLMIRAFENVIVALICLAIFFVLSKLGIFKHFTSPLQGTNENQLPNKVEPVEDGILIETIVETITPESNNSLPSDVTTTSSADTQDIPDEKEQVENKEIEGDDGKRRRKRGSRGGKKNKKREINEHEQSKVVTSVNNDITEDDETDDQQETQLPTKLRNNSIIHNSKNEKLTKISDSLSITDDILGFGSHGTMVFKGYFENRPVAVKRMLLDFFDVASHEINLLQESDDHSNVIRYFCSQEHNKFLYIALELCCASLEDVIEKKTNLNAEIDIRLMLYQIANGVHHLHSLKIVHRDIKPQNILVAASTKTVKSAEKKQETKVSLRFLISDFGLCKKLDTDQSSFKGTTANAAGTSGWRAPELLLDTSPAYLSSTMKNKVRLTRSVDIFSAGCVFFYVLTGGYHPFGDRYIREGNIIKNEYDLSLLNHLQDAHIIKDLIGSMIQRNPLIRPDISEVMKHPYFWSTEKKLEFLLKVSDRFEIERRDPPSELLLKFESIAKEVLGPKGWFEKFDDTFIDNLGKYRKYNTHKLMDLLRAVRNKYHHYQDLPKELAVEIGSLPDGFYQYFAAKFPRLLLCVYKLTSQALPEDELLSPYF